MKTLLYCVYPKVPAKIVSSLRLFFSTMIWALIVNNLIVISICYLSVIFVILVSRMIFGWWTKFNSTLFDRASLFDIYYSLNKSRFGKQLDKEELFSVR